MLQNSVEIECRDLHGQLIKLREINAVAKTIGDRKISMERLNTTYPMVFHLNVSAMGLTYHLQSLTIMGNVVGINSKIQFTSHSRHQNIFVVDRQIAHKKIKLLEMGIIKRMIVPKGSQGDNITMNWRAINCTTWPLHPSLPGKKQLTQ